MEPQVRFIIACPRSGSTLFMRIFAESPVCAVTSRLILMGKAGSGNSFSPDYSILEDPSSHKVFKSAMDSGKPFLVSKEELGNNTRKGECLCDICPHPSAYSMVRPVFLIRDPVRVFDSWKQVGWTDAQSLTDCYINVSRMLHEAPSDAVSCILYEKLIQEPHTEIERICRHWGVPFADTMLSFKHSFGSSFLYQNDRERTIYCEEKPLGLFTTVEAKSSVERDVPYHNLLSNAEKDSIEKNAGLIYLSCWKDDVLRLRDVLTKKSWIGFDLDDTLHEFRCSSGQATTKVLEQICERYGIAMGVLKEEYATILKAKTANAFSDGKTSTDYRRDRFTSILAYFSMPPDHEFMEQLLESYEATLTASLELKCGALDLLSCLKALNKKIVVMTEGPQDAQERTIQALGINNYIDFLATTNKFGCTKIDGLFPKVLQHLSISPEEIAYVGDNEQRDMEPAMAEGIFSIHFAETKHVALNTTPPRINTLRKLQYILSDEH
ncbi:MAG: hypothetical protein Q9182_001244 [Xanthomendoza sp. 2 TL-2023]